MAFKEKKDSWQFAVEGFSCRFVSLEQRKKNRDRKEKNIA